MGFIFLFLGALYGGNFGFFKLWGLVGYESAGVFFGLVGLVAGAVLGLYLSLRKK